MVGTVSTMWILSISLLNGQYAFFVSGVEENGAKTESSISTTNRYRQTIDLALSQRAFRNSKIHDINKLYSDQTEWLPISSSSQTKRKIKIKDKSSINMFDFTKANLVEQSTARSKTDSLAINRNDVASDTIKPNALGINVIHPKESFYAEDKYDSDSNSFSISENPFEKNHIPHTDSNLVQSFIHNSLPDLKTDPSSFIIHPKFPNNSTNKYLVSNNNHQPWGGNNSHKNQFIIVEDVDPSLLPKPPNPPQPPWYDTWHDTTNPHDTWHDNTKPHDTWHENPKPQQSDTPSVVFHSEITYFPPDPEPEPAAPLPEYFHIPIPRPEHQVTPEAQPQYNYHYPSYKPDPNPGPESTPPYTNDASKPVKPVYEDPVFVEPNTPIFITPVSITNIQNNPLNPVVATNGNPPPSIVVLEDLSTLDDDPSAGSGLDASMSTQLTGSMTLGDGGAAAAAAGAGNGAGGAGSAAGVGAAAAAGAGAAGAAAAAAASSAALATGISGGVVGTAAAGNAAACNNIQVNTFNGQQGLNRQGIQCPENVNINLNSGTPPDGGFDDPAPPAQAPPADPGGEDGGIILGSFSLFEYFSSIFGAINILNPVGFAFWALMFAPLSVLVTSGLGAVAFFFPWLFPRLWLGRSFQNGRSLQNDTDILFSLKNKLKHDVYYLERRLLTIEAHKQTVNPYLKNVKQRRKKK